MAEVPVKALSQDARSLDDFVASFYSDAHLDSHGKFTVDLERRLQKMAKYQFSEPEKFVLALTKAATLGGATVIKLYAVPGGFALAFDGQVCTPEELEQVKLALELKSADSKSSRLQHLQTALNLVGQLNLRLITLQLGPGLPSLQVQGRQVQLLEQEAVASTEVYGMGQCLCLQGGGWGLLQRFFESRVSKIRRTVEDLLRRRCALGPAQLALQNRPEPGERTLKDPSACLRIGSGPPSSFPQTEQLLRNPQATVGQLLLTGSDLRGTLLLGDPSQPGEILFVACGVVYTLPMTRAPGRSACQVILWSNEFHGDLAYENLVESEELRQLLASIPFWVAEIEWLQLARAFARGGEKAVLETPFWDRIFWDYRQRALHQVQETEVVWDQPRGPSRPLEIGHGLTFNDAARTFSRFKYLPVGPTPLRTDEGIDVFQRPGPKDFLLDTLFPQQVPYVEVEGRAVPRFCNPTRLLRASSFWECSNMQQSCQLGLNLEPLRHDAMIWHYQAPTYGNDVALVQGGTARLPRGLTVAVLHHRWDSSEAFEFSDFSQILQLHKRAWLNPQTQAQRARHEALLQHWLLLQLWRPMPGDFVWLWTEDDKRLPLHELQPGNARSLRVTPPTLSLLRQVYGRDRIPGEDSQN